MPQDSTPRARLLALFLILNLTTWARAEMPESLLPLFGGEGEAFTHQAQNGHVVRGWLPIGWVDNSEWAVVSATYERLVDRPDEAAGAVRIKLEKCGEESQLQFTSYVGERTYEGGKRYRVCGWLRSAEPRNVSVFVRQVGEPYEAYALGQVTSGRSWKPFEFNFQLPESNKALIYLALQELGTLDVAGVTVAEGGAGPSLLPTFGAEGEEFRKDSTHGRKVQGWLPTEWHDNSEWGPVNATYTRLDEDVPPETMSAVRIKVESLKAETGDEGLLQLTTFAGPESFQPGRTYEVTGWARSAAGTPFGIAARQNEEPWANYYETQVTPGAEWKRFAFTFRPEKSLQAIIMLSIHQPGMVDLAGVTLTEK